MGKRLNGIFILILLLGAVLRLKGVTNPYLDDQGWRQADTASMALNMMGHLGDFPDVFFPMLYYDGAGPQPVELEFPFFPYLLAWTWSLLGWQDLWGRLWGIFFSLLTIGGIYRFGKLALSERAGLWAAAFYAFLPLTTYYGRVVMPEPVAQAFSIWALTAIVSWRNNPTRLGLLRAALLMSGAVLAKLPQLMIFPVALLLGFYPLGRKMGRLGLYCFLSLVLPVLYYSWVHLGAGEASQFVSGILSHQVMEGSAGYGEILYKNLKSGLGLPLLLALTGLALMVQRKAPAGEVRLALMIWAGISIVYVAVICLKIPLDYYLVPLALPVVLSAGYTLDVWGGDREGNGVPAFVAGVVLIGLLWVSQWLSYGSKYQWNEELLSQSQWIRQHTAADSVLVLSGAPPMTLYYSQRYGYRLIREDSQAWEDLQKLPGDYLVALPGSRGEEFWRRADDAYPQVGPGVYRLKKTPSAGNPALIEGI